VGSYVTQAAKGRLVESLSELAGSLQRSGTGNPIALLNLADILASDLQNKKAPEAYMRYTVRIAIGTKLRTVLPKGQLAGEVYVNICSQPA